MTQLRAEAYRQKEDTAASSICLLGELVDREPTWHWHPSRHRPTQDQLPVDMSDHSRCILGRSVLYDTGSLLFLVRARKGGWGRGTTREKQLGVFRCSGQGNEQSNSISRFTYRILQEYISFVALVHYSSIIGV